MIQQIQRQQYMDIVKARKRKPAAKSRYLVFEGVNGKYYRCDKTGMPALKEMWAFNKQLKATIDKQRKLF